jgi:hypothetical protein
MKTARSIIHMLILRYIPTVTLRRRGQLINSQKMPSPLERENLRVLLVQALLMTNSRRSLPALLLAVNLMIPLCLRMKKSFRKSSISLKN